MLKEHEKDILSCPKLFTEYSLYSLFITHKYNKTIHHLGMIRDEHIGNLIIVFNIIYPERLSSEQIRKLKEIL